MVQQTNGNGTETLRPSTERRNRLRAESVDPPSVSNFFAIDRYWNASDQVYSAFLTSFEKRQLDLAYVYGLRYSDFCMQGIRTHDYFNRRDGVSRREQMNSRVLDVVEKLELVAKWMDAEEAEKEAKRQALIKKQQEERRRLQREIDAKRIEAVKKRVSQQKSSSSSVSTESLQESALAKLQRLSNPQGMAQQPLQPPQVQDPNKKVKWNLPAEPDGQLLSQLSADAGDLPPPLLPPGSDASQSPSNGSAAPPSYNSILKQSS
ncbi:MAG: hypothetical protein SGARI_006876, partial [Bacillariaceae sp.]